MSIFEIMGELINPGSMGKMDFKYNDQNIHQKFIPTRFAISMMIIGIVEYLFISQSNSYNNFGYIMKANAFLFIYLLISFKINIKPDYKNLGWIPFLINNPFKFSDNINRILVILNIFFMPGKYVSKNIVEFYKHLKIK